MDLSATQLDRLGQRLVLGPVTDADLRLLHEYRLTFAAAASAVMSVLRDHLAYEPTARPAKSTQAIVEKLKREKIRLTQMQDIAGCRVIVATLSEQAKLVSKLDGLLEIKRVHNRLEFPSHGYRAMHLVVKADGRLVEVQIRTELQHLWAAMSEKVADFYGHELKYGVGHAAVSEKLLMLSDLAHESDLKLDLQEMLRERVSASDSTELKADFEDACRLNLADRLVLRDGLEQFAAEPRILVEPNDLSN